MSLETTTTTTAATTTALPTPLPPPVSEGAAAARPSPRIGALLLAQFLCTFVDKAWNLVIAQCALRHAGMIDDSGQLVVSEQMQQRTYTFYFMVFTVPVMLASVPSALLADRFSKRTILTMSMGLLVLLVGVGTVILAVNPTGGNWMFVLLVLLGLQASLFGPAKYGILPEIVPHDRLSDANGQLEMWNFFAMVSGTAASAWLVFVLWPHSWVVGAIFTLLAAIGYLSAQRIPRVAAASTGPKSRPWETISGAVKAIGADPTLALAVAGTVAFWLIATLLGQTMQVDAKSRLHFPDIYSTVPLAFLGVGVGLGSAFAGKQSARKVETGLLPLGAFLLAGFTMMLAFFEPGRVGTFAIMLLMGSSAGLLLVPLDALLQWRAPEDRRGAVITITNALVFGGMSLGTFAAFLGTEFSLTTRGLFVSCGLFTLGVGVWALLVVPQAFVRLILFLLTHSIYRLKVVGRQHVPEKGGALLVPNHVSFADGLFIIATLDRPVRFLVDSSFFARPILGRVLRWLKAIPISSEGGPRSILRALREAGKHLNDGQLVCIFAEGQITRTGMLNPFRRGLERIVKGRNAPIIPVHLDRVWGSVFSFSGQRFFWKLPERIAYPVTVSFGAPLAASTPIAEVRRHVQMLGEAAWSERRGDRKPLHHSFIRAARRRPWRILFADQKTPKVTRMRALISAMALARTLRGPFGSDERIGILLPSSIAGALANLAVTLAGRVSINLNFTAGKAAMASAARQAGLRVVVTSREFLARAKVELPDGLLPIWMEEIQPQIDKPLQREAQLLALTAPARLIEAWCGAPRAVKVDDVVTILFSSGSTGEPKGVMLTHFNIDSNVEALAQAFRTTIYDRILGILPLFHSFGYTATLWFPTIEGLSTVWHPSALDVGAIGELVERHRVTFLLATPTLLSMFLRRCTPAQFGTLRVVLTGAEKLSDRLVTAFEDFFGIKPLEGYGATECSPVVATSTPDFRAPGFYQPGWRRGTVGQPIPGVTVRVVTPETFEPLPPGQEGLLLVRGPNVMKGYLGRDELTAQTVRDGWYVTGDLAQVDEDGFIKITDRASRFSKIGGEMVPHGRIEEELHKAANLDSPSFVVTGVPDESKGERLAVLHTLTHDEIPPLLQKLAAAGLPNLFIPRLDSFVGVAELPLLGTGKIDLRAVKQKAQEALNDPHGEVR
jgi:acyl-[acyl-carrier-protein]-phospholipid O-acyltransferase/long-chain-fatty-acid--[acyl-carrier-protein] ligase